MEEADGSLGDLEGRLLNEDKLPKKIKAIIIILIIIILLLIASIIILAIYFTIIQDKDKENNNQDNKKSEEDYLLEINGFKEEWYDIYGTRRINISYLENDVIPNTFRKGKSNYIEELGDINEGKDYTKHDVNVYDLYIPHSVLSRKDKHNGVILFVHGGGFENNTKEETECFSIRFCKMGYITANIEYTNTLDKYKERGFFRILDEITACIKSIKKELVSEGFKGDLLELSLYGISAGGQLILLYTFSVNDIPLPIKFIMNSVGVSSIEPEYWYKPAIPNVTLDSIELVEDIKNAKQNKSIVPVDQSLVLHITNLMVGKKLSQKDLESLIVDNVIQTDDPKYQEIFKYAKYGCPLYVYKNKNCTVPMLCLYGGNDDLVGVVHYSYLREKYVENGGENNIELVYMKYAGHERFHHGTEHNIIAMKEMHAKMVAYAKKYFTQD